MRRVRGRGGAAVFDLDFGEVAADADGEHGATAVEGGAERKHHGGGVEYHGEIRDKATAEPGRVGGNVVIRRIRIEASEAGRQGVAIGAFEAAVFVGGLGAGKLESGEQFVVGVEELKAADEVALVGEADVVFVAVRGFADAGEVAGVDHVLAGGEAVLLGAAVVDRGAEGKIGRELALPLESDGSGLAAHGGLGAVGMELGERAVGADDGTVRGVLVFGDAGRRVSTKIDGVEAPERARAARVAYGEGGADR